MDELYLQAKQLPFLISWGIWVNPLALFLQLSKLIQISYLVKYWLRVSERPFARVLKRHFPRVLKRPPSHFQMFFKSFTGIGRTLCFIPGIPILWCQTGLRFFLSSHKGVEPKIMGKPPKSSILIGFSIINHPFWGVSPYFWKHP